MARVIGKTKSWMWWVAGFFCALVFGRGAGAGEVPAPKPVYGMPAPRGEQPTVLEAQQKQAEKLVADYLAPVAATEPTPEQKAAIEKLIKDFGSADFKVREAASTEIVKQGPAALGLLREAAKSSDAEVATRAGAAIVAIETAARQTQVDEIRKLGAAGQAVVRQEVDNYVAYSEKDVATVRFLEQNQTPATPEQIQEARAAAKASAKKLAALRALLVQLAPARARGPGPGAVQALYGVRIAPIE
jgi:hypothetical protein